MTIDLTKVGIEKGLKYESIYTTINSKKEKNAAPIGVIAISKDIVTCSIFENTQTLKNIIETKKYVINIVEDPMIYTLSTIGNLPENYFTKDKDIAILKNTPAYLVCKVIDIEKNESKKSPADKKEKLFKIKAEVSEIVINDKCVKAINRGMHCLIESLVNYTRFNIVNKEKKEYYLGRLKENQRIINKVGDNETKEAMNLLKEAMKKLN